MARRRDGGAAISARRELLTAIPPCLCPFSLAPETSIPFSLCFSSFLSSSSSSSSSSSPPFLRSVSTAADPVDAQHRSESTPSSLETSSLPAPFAPPPSSLPPLFSSSSCFRYHPRTEAHEAGRRLSTCHLPPPLVSEREQENTAKTRGCLLISSSPPLLPIGQSSSS